MRPTRWSPRTATGSSFTRSPNRLRRIDPDIARTFANGAFMARAPLHTALDHFDRFAEVITRIRGNVPFARLAAREPCRAPGPRGRGHTMHRGLHPTSSTR